MTWYNLVVKVSCRKYIVWLCRRECIALLKTDNTQTLARILVAVLVANLQNIQMKIVIAHHKLALLANYDLTEKNSINLSLNAQNVIHKNRHMNT